MERTTVACLFVLLVELVLPASALGNEVVMQQFTQDHSFDGFISGTGFSGNIFTRSLTECGVKCTSNIVCTSFFYTSVNNTCQLHDVTLSSPYGLLVSSSTVYFVMAPVIVGEFQCPLDDLEFRSILLDDSTTLTYRVYKNKLPYATAELECNNQGGRLLQVLTEARNIFTQNLLMCTGYYSIGDYWLDGNNLAATDYNDLTEWKTSDGQVLPAQFWDPSQPNSPTVDHCVAMYEAYSFAWADRPCTVANNYICEMP